MPLLKNKLTNLSITKVEVVNTKAGQKKNLEELFLEQGFAAFIDPTESSVLHSISDCSACGCGCGCCESKPCS